ncbi:anthranilate synthase component II [Heyndrickxia acidicola]|uniref:Aminodeoxychorismate/anthranilate synthase component II n=1 Tax=Heyndrickxia acidicola TaxID=209389 RepID=A0ABU6MJZ0_9BACI|nr:aminodeoxychorismate/anthranilate synthase component II [Heyndrickxia acidicola]MED1204991.1 aminodeoxychorismate/anthranilate synthase component II [Heyndrickxia acidicola]
MILLLDNYDSFTYNLYQYIAETGEQVRVVRNDEMTVEELDKLKPEAIIVSPGPGKPEDAGITIEVIQSFYQKVPILGVCLGHQALGAAFGAEIEQAREIKHGKTSMITHVGTGIFDYMQQPLEVMRYHSLVVKKETIPPSFKVLARSMDDGEVMAIKHYGFPLYGVQFHPESIGTKGGKMIIQNFLKEIRKEAQHATIS